jgi:2,3-bisphosphoglycerate-independent phosphoglycerate mutase
MISAVDLLKGIAKINGMRVIEVDGATGNYDTNFSGKATACLNALRSGLDLVYLHMEAPDECGHHGDTEHKIFSIEEIDKKVVKPIIEGLKADGEDFAVLVCPDHPTPLSIMTHCADPIPYIIYRSNREVCSKVSGYDEEQAESTGVFIENGFELMQKLING